MASPKTAHTEVPAGGQKPFPPFQKDTFASQLVWFVICFLALYLVASRLALPRIGSIFEARRAKAGEDLANAERLRGESEAALAAYEKSLAEARSRAQALDNEARQLANREAEKTRKVLEEQLNQKLGEAERSIAATRNAAMANVRGIATEAARAIVERLIGAVPAGASVEAAVDDSLKSVRDQI